MDKKYYPKPRSLRRGNLFITRRKVSKFNLLIISFILLSSLFAISGKVLAAGINVDASKTSAMPEVFEPHFFPWYLNNAQSYPIQKITNDGLAKYIYGVNATVSWNVYNNADTQPPSFDKTISEMKRYFSDLKLNTWFSNNHINFVIGINQMPRWLSSDPTNENPIIPGSTNNLGATKIWGQSPPKCYDFECAGGQKGWASLIKEIVHYFNVELGLNAPLNVWHEPSWNWFYGTEQDYFQLYKYAIIGAKAADPNIKIAGPATVHLARKVKLDRSGYESSNPMMQDFIEYAGTHRLDYDNDKEGVHLHYDKWPIDIISFSGLELYGDSWKDVADQTRGWLTSKGYSANTPMFVQEFGTWFFNGTNYLDPNRDKEYMASYVINQLGWLDRAAINYYYFTTLFDFHTYSSYPQTATQEFIGTNDPWTSNYVIKSVYNAFKVLSILDGKQEGELSNRAQATYNDNDFITAVASQTKNKSKTRVLLSNFLPSFASGMNTQYLLGIYRSDLLSKGYTITEANLIIKAVIATYGSHPPSEGITLSYLTEIINLTDFPDPLNDTQVKADLIDCSPQVVQKLADLNYYTANPRQVEVAISGLPFSGTATLTTYTIDKNHSNSCKVNKATESPSTSSECGVNGIIDQKVNQAKTDSVNAAADYLLSIGYSQTQVNAFANCALTPGCNIQTLINNYCTSNPSLCDKLKADITEATKLRAGLFNYGTYTATTGKKYSITTYIDKINSDPTLFTSYTNITVPLEGSKQETGINIINGVYSGTITMQPYSVILLEISGTSDTQTPSTPTNLTATAVSSTQINLTWTASTDNVGVTGYRIYRGGTQIATSVTNSYSNTGLSPANTYTYTVVAYDTAGNVSNHSISASATTQVLSDNISPSSITNLSVSNITQTSMDLSWTSAGDDGNVGAASSYDIRYSTSVIAESNWNTATQITGEPAPLAAGTTQTMIIVGLSPNTTYYFALKTADEIPNWSGLSNVISTATQGITTCTSFTYSVWGACQPDNTQSRTTTSSLPLGCTGGNPILTQTCTYTPPTCTSFTYSAWSTCQPNNAETRTIVSQLPQTCTGGNPILSQICNYISIPPFCTSFTYSAWGACQPDNTQSRTTTSSLPLGCTGGNPILTQTCTYTPPTCTSFTYSAWSACQPNNTQSRVISNKSPLGCTGGNLILSQSCTYISSSQGAGGGYSSDVTPPSQPQNFQVIPQGSKINLTWTNPTDADLARVLIIRKENSAPTSKNDGQVIYEGTAHEFIDTNLDNNKKYYYAIYAYDKKPNYSQPVIVSTQTKILFEYLLVKTSGSSNIYVIKENKRELIPNWQSFLSFGYQLANLKVISQEEMAKYELIDLTTIDSDKDGLTNAQERRYGTDAAKADTDGDGYNDYEEISKGYSPLIPANIKSGAVFAYGKPRLSSLANEQEQARTLRSELEKKYTKGQLKGLSAKNWSIVVNSYVYGGYPIEAIVKALKFSGKTVHPTITWSVWQKSKDYSDYINK